MPEAQPIDVGRVDRDWEFRYSSPKIVLIVVLGIVLALLMLGIAIDKIRSPPDNVLIRPVAWSGVVLLSASSIISVLRLFRVSEPVLSLSPEGIRDTRIALDRIPWSAVRRISERRSTWGTPSYVRLDIDGDVNKALNRPLTARLIGPSINLFRSRISVSVIALDVDFRSLLVLCTAFHEAYGAR